MSNIPEYIKIGYKIFIFDPTIEKNKFEENKIIYKKNLISWSKILSL